MMDTPIDKCTRYSKRKKEWSYSNRSQNIPRQTNTYDCSMFTLVSIYLLSRGLELSPLVCNQQSISRKKVRPSIAHLILQKNQMQKEATAPLPLRLVGMPHRRPTNPANARKRPHSGN